MSTAGEGVEREGMAPEAAAEEALAVEEARASLEATVGDRGFVAELLDDFLSALLQPGLAAARDERSS